MSEFPETRGAKVNARTNHATGYGTRMDFDMPWREQLSQTFADGDTRNLYDSLGYPETRALGFDDFYAWYLRNPYASPVVDRYPDSTWQEAPDVSDDIEQDGDDGDDTAFEQGVSELLDGDATRQSLLHRCHSADRFARLGQYSLVVLGYADDSDLTDPVDGGQFDGLDDLAYIAVFDEGRVADFDTVADLSDERYGLPETYTIEVEEGRTEQVHHSRIVHVPGEDLLEDDIHSIPALLQVANPLLDIEKILGGSAEMFWRGAYQGLVASPPTDNEGRPLQFDDDGDGLKDQIAEYEHNLRRVIFSAANVESLGSDIASPADHVDEQVKAICTSVGIPKNIFLGNEMGERATTEDRKRWAQQVGMRRNTYAEPKILREILDRLQFAGVLPEPEAETYTVEWPPLEEPSEADRAETANTKAQALNRASGGTPDRLATIEEIREEVFGWDAERGAEAPDVSVAVQARTEGETSDGSNADPADEIDESDDAVQEQMEQMRANWSRRPERDET